MINVLLGDEWIFAHQTTECKEKVCRLFTIVSTIDGRKRDRGGNSRSYKIGDLNRRVSCRRNQIVLKILYINFV